MNDILNTGLSFWQFIIGILTLTLSIATIKIAINFDLNKFLGRRDANNLQKLKNACPHFAVAMLEGNEFEVRSLFYKPAGTMQHFCRQCGVGTHLDLEQHEREANHYVKNPSQLMEEQKKFTKLAKKSGKI